MKHTLLIVLLLVAAQHHLAGADDKRNDIASPLVDVSKNADLVNGLYRLFEQADADATPLRDFLKKHVVCEEVDLVPQKLDLYVVPETRTHAKSSVYSEFGCDMALPWGPPTKYRVATNKYDNVTLGMSFSNGIIVNLFDLTSQGEVHNFLSNDVVSAVFRLAQVEDLTKSHQDLWREAMSVSSASLNQTNSIQQLMRTGCLMIIKKSFWPFKTRHLFQFKTVHVSGFQFGSPEEDPMLMIELFDNSGRHATVVFRSNEASAIGILLTQQDVNNTIVSFRMTRGPNKAPETR